MVLKNLLEKYCILGNTNKLSKRRDQNSHLYYIFYETEAGS